MSTDIKTVFVGSNLQLQFFSFLYFMTKSLNNVIDDLISDYEGTVEFDTLRNAFNALLPLISFINASLQVLLNVYQEFDRWSTTLTATEQALYTFLRAVADIFLLFMRIVPTADNAESVDNILHYSTRGEKLLLYTIQKISSFFSDLHGYLVAKIHDTVSVYSDSVLLAPYYTCMMATSALVFETRSRLDDLYTWTSRYLNYPRIDQELQGYLGIVTTLLTNTNALIVQIYLLLKYIDGKVLLSGDRVVVAPGFTDEPRSDDEAYLFRLASQT